MVGGGGGMWSEGEKVEVCTKQNNGNIRSGGESVIMLGLRLA